MRTSEPTRFDPYAIPHPLDEERASAVIIGGLTPVVQGSDEPTASSSLPDPDRTSSDLKQLRIG
jgi:hypothetical protein